MSVTFGIEWRFFAGARTLRPFRADEDTEASFPRALPWASHLHAVGVAHPTSQSIHDTLPAWIRGSSTGRCRGVITFIVSSVGVENHATQAGTDTVQAGALE